MLSGLITGQGVYFTISVAQTFFDVMFGGIKGRPGNRCNDTYEPVPETNNQKAKKKLLYKTL